jgi:hypothetical protein
MSDATGQPDAADTTEVQPDAEPDTTTDQGADGDLIEDAETFPASVVKDLRKESAGYRERAKDAEARAEATQRRLHAALTAATGKLADPSDLTFDAEHLDDADTLAAAIDALTDAKPHLKARRPTGDVSQGARGDAVAPFNLIDAIKART